MSLEAEIGHDGSDKTAADEPSLAMPGRRDQGHELVAVDESALLIGNDHAVGVAIERDADIGARLDHLGAHRLRRRRAAFLVDVEAIRVVTDGDDLGAKLPESRRGNLVGAAIGSIDDDAQALEPERLREGALGGFDIARLRILDALGAAELVLRGCQARPIGMSISFSIASSCSSESL